MIPLRDDIPSRQTPVVNWILIGVCVVVFVLQSAGGQRGSQLVEQFGFIPLRLSQPDADIQIPSELRTDQLGNRVIVTRPAAQAAVPPVATLLTCIFLHGGVLHLLGNVWFLWIFGDNVEDRFGHLGYAAMYGATGVTASLVHYWSNPESVIPTIGASGAVAGVMGAYLVSYPHARVLTLVPLFVIFFSYVIPAPLFLVFWLGAQISGVLQPADPASGGVAWWAHIGGFVAGAVATYALSKAGWIREVNHSRRATVSHRIRF